MSKLFTVLLIMLEIPINYFDGPTNLFSDLSLAKFLDTSTKSFFQCSVKKSFALSRRIKFLL